MVHLHYFPFNFFGRCSLFVLKIGFIVNIDKYSKLYVYGNI